MINSHDSAFLQTTPVRIIKFLERVRKAKFRNVNRYFALSQTYNWGGGGVVFQKAIPVTGRGDP
jgi:hypothetical protein